MSFENVDTSELVDRYDFLIKKYAELALELVPLLDKFGKHKKELQLLTVEFVNRGVDVKDPEKLSMLVMEEMNKKGITPNE
jgi:hypothetical protein